MSSGGFKPELTLSPALAGTMLVSSLLSCSDVWILWMVPVKLDDPQDTAIMCIYVSRLAHRKWISIPRLGCRLARIAAHRVIRKQTYLLGDPYYKRQVFQMHSYNAVH